MPTTKAAAKAMRQTKKRTAANRAVTTALKKLIKKTRDAVKNGKADEAESALNQTIHALDKAARKGLLHANAAARKKSRLTRIVRSLRSQPQQTA